MSAQREYVGVLKEGESLDAFLARMRPRLKQLLRNCRVPPVDAEDVLQETFLALLRQWESIRHKESWLISILKFKIAVYWKRVQDERLVAMDPLVVEAFLEPRAPDQGREVPLWDFKAAVRKVGKKDQALLWLRFGMGLPLNEVAERLGYRPSGIRKLLHRAVARLKKALSRRPHEPETTRPHDGTDEAEGRRMEGVRMSAKQALVHAIQAEMAHQGISRRILAGRLGCTQENIAQMLDDQRPGTRLDTAERLARALGRRLFLALIPDTIAERIDSEARRQNIPTEEFVLQLIVKALEIEKRTALVGIFSDPEMASGEDLEDYLRQNWGQDLDE